MALPTVEVETPSPKCSSKTWRCSSRVRSSLASRCLGSHSLSIAPFLEGLPGIGPGSTSPVSRRLFIQRFMVGIDTEKVLATSSLGVPASTAASTLNLRSFEYGFMPGGYHIWIDTYGCRCESYYEGLLFFPRQTSCVWPLGMVAPAHLSSSVLYQCSHVAPVRSAPYTKASRHSIKFSVAFHIVA